MVITESLQVNDCQSQKCFFFFSFLFIFEGGGGGGGVFLFYFYFIFFCCQVYFDFDSGFIISFYW